MKECKKCHEIKELVEFHKHKKTKDRRNNICKKCQYKIYGRKRIDNSMKNKEKLVEEFGGKCVKCGYNRCMKALDFHHRDPLEKDEMITDLLKKSLDEARKEAEKCDLLCANCHREEHFNMEEVSSDINDDKPKKQCKGCKVYKSISNFAFHKNTKDGYHLYCNECRRKMGKKIKDRNRELITSELGGCCSRCGYNKCIAALDFHHKDPSKKSFQIAQRWTMTLEHLKEEASKCELICANCHREEHSSN